MHCRWIPALFALLGTSAFSRPAPALANVVIVVIRHAEKPPEGNSLTPAGFARANAYPGYFQKLRVDGKPFHVDHIFAAADSKNSMRSRLTVEPLGKSLNEPVDVRYSNKDFEGLFQDIQTHSYGKDIVVCWHHGHIPDLLSTFGAPANFIPGNKWPDSTFDWAVELKFDKTGHLDVKRSHIVHEHLMPGDGA